MSWIRLDDGWLDHPKISRLDLRTREAWLRVLTHCARQNKGGFASDESLRRLRITARMRRELVHAPAGFTVGLWEPVEGGVVIHDFDDYQAPDDLRAKRAEIGRRGGIASGRSRRLTRTTDARDAHETRTTDARDAHGLAGKTSESLNSREAIASSKTNTVPSRPDLKTKGGSLGSDGDPSHAREGETETEPRPLGDEAQTGDARRERELEMDPTMTKPKETETRGSGGDPKLEADDSWILATPDGMRMLEADLARRERTAAPARSVAPRRISDTLGDFSRKTRKAGT
jgi:hypothetical protein